MLQQETPWYASRTIWGAVISLACMALSLFGRTLPAETAGWLQEEVPALVVNAVGLVSAVVAIIGRLRRDIQPIRR